MSFDHQAIIGFFTGSVLHDSPVKVSCLSLYLKWLATRGTRDCPGAFVMSQNIVDGTSSYKPNWCDADVASLKGFLPRVDETWRLYLVGHGNWINRRCGGVD